MMLRTHVLFAAALAGISSTAQALVWTSPNIPDDNTIALYRFDENEGTTAGNAVGGYPSLTLTESGSWTSDSAWLATPTGGSLASDGVAYAAVLSAMGSIDWSEPVTISMWMKATGNLMNDNYLFHFSYGGWRNRQAYVGYRTDWNNQYLAMDGVATEPRENQAWIHTAIDGQWHHVALVYDNISETASFYFDNVKQSEWSVATGLEGVVTEFMNVAKFQGYVDELLIQREVITDFSDGLNAVIPEPTTTMLLGLVSLSLLRRQRVTR